MKFAQRLKELRKENDLTQLQLANMLNYGYTAIANYENGRNQPRLNDIIKMANIFNVSVDYFVGNSDIKYKNQNHLYYNINNQLHKNGIKLKDENYFLIELLYYNANQIFIVKNIAEYNIDKLFEKAVQNCQYSFSKSLLLLLQNKLYYDIVKNCIAEQFYNNQH
ncbi:MAG: helix-turn-helix transcriptional regulator [Firmicutes bacterium]|nr:helix-turn-helix transcriptional regulator [Bacillota bacterium]